MSEDGLVGFGRRRQPPAQQQPQAVSFVDDNGRLQTEAIIKPGQATRERWLNRRHKLSQPQQTETAVRVVNSQVNSCGLLSQNINCSGGVITPRISTW
jgi:hypothetical protein